MLTAFALIWVQIGYFATSEEITFTVAVGLLALRLTGTAMFLFAMRMIGVYCRHYADVCPSLWLDVASGGVR